ncbi:DUF397 domain-containing protein [Streptomyces microflavus]
MPDLKWLKSPHSEASANNCVKVVVRERGIAALRDSTRPPLVIPVRGSTFHALAQGVKTGMFDPIPRQAQRTHSRYSPPSIPSSTPPKAVP